MRAYNDIDVDDKPDFGSICTSITFSSRRPLFTVHSNTYATYTPFTLGPLPSSYSAKLRGNRPLRNAQGLLGIRDIKFGAPPDGAHRGEDLTNPLPVFSLLGAVDYNNVLVSVIHFVEQIASCLTQ